MLIMKLQVRRGKAGEWENVSSPHKKLPMPKVVLQERVKILWKETKQK